MDDTLTRLKETADIAIKAFGAWSKNNRDAALTGAAEEAVHELRKVTSRLEIELVTAERKEQTQAPIPIPSHRASMNAQRIQVAPQEQEDIAPSASSTSAAVSASVASLRRRKPQDETAAAE